MPTTTKMGIVYPSSTDLVKDGATNMGTIATTVDAKTGMVLVNTTNMSGVASQSVNSVFTSAFENYRIVFDLSNGDGSVTLKLRASGTDTTTNYDYLTIYGLVGTGFQIASNALGTDEFYLFNMTTAIDGSGTGYIDVFNPNVAFPTSVVSDNFGASGGAIYWYKTYGRQTASTQFDGFTIADNGTGLTGAVRTYGYNQ
jgi:hypothetical protein